jgi:hypothetical protein
MAASLTSQKVLKRTLSYRSKLRLLSFRKPYVYDDQKVDDAYNEQGDEVSYGRYIGGRNGKP